MKTILRTFLGNKGFWVLHKMKVIFWICFVLNFFATIYVFISSNESSNDNWIEHAGKVLGRDNLSIYVEALFFITGTIAEVGQESTATTSGEMIFVMICQVFSFPFAHNLVPWYSLCGYASRRSILSSWKGH
jgi:hypothetical protein